MSENEKPLPDLEERNESSFVRAIGSWLRRGLGREDETTWRESVEELIEEEEDIAEQISAEERDLLMNLLRFGKLRAEDAMVPRSDIVAVSETATLEETVDLIKSDGHSRMPVYRENLDDVIGMIHIKDVTDYWGSDQPFQLTDIMRGIVFVPESMSAVDLLAEMRQTRHHMAVIVDEYGGTHGLVTIEDLVEEIVGEIEDEHDEVDERQLVPDADGFIEADGRTRVEELERTLGMVLLEEEDGEDVDTLGGLVSAIAGRVPRRGERIEHQSGLVFEIVEADPRRVTLLRVRLPDGSNHHVTE